MTPQEYKTLRKRLGTQQEAAKILDIKQETICRREAGRLPIRTESAMAIRWIVTRYDLKGAECG